MRCVCRETGFDVARLRGRNEPIKATFLVHPRGEIVCHVMTKAPTEEEEEPGVFSLLSTSLDYEPLMNSVITASV